MTNPKLQEMELQKTRALARKAIAQDQVRAAEEDARAIDALIAGFKLGLAEPTPTEEDTPSA